jgi:multiple sugar transport system substrate-binding protein
MGGSINSDEALAAKIIAVPFPGKGSGSLGHSLATSNGASILESSANKDAAAKVIEWITGKERSLLLSENTGALSPRNDVLLAGSDLVEKNPRTKVFSQELERALTRPSTPQWVVIEDAITTMVQSVAVGDAEPRDALKTAAAIISEALKK